MKGGENMATEKINETSKIIVNVETGVTESGKAKTSARTISNVNTALSIDDRRTIGSEYAALQTYPLSTIRTQDTADLVED